MKGLFSIIYFALALMYGLSAYANDCAKSTTESTCRVVKCPESFRDFVGVWHGREQMELNADSLSSEVQLIFSNAACLRDKGDLERILIGRQTRIIPSGRNNGPKTEYRDVVISEQGDALKGIADNDSRLLYKKSDMKFSEKNNATILKVPNREVEFQKLGVGQISYFAGKAWTLTNNGKLIAAADFLMKAEYDPASNTVQEKLYYHGSKGRGPSNFVDIDVYDLITDSYSGSRTDRRMIKKEKGSSHNALDLLVDGKFYREERISLDNKSGDVLAFKSGDQISASEFRNRIEEQ